MPMKRVALFLKGSQIRKLKALARKQELPWAFVVRRAIDFYFEALRQEGEEVGTEPEENAPTAAEEAQQRQQDKDLLIDLRRSAGLRVDDKTIEEALKSEDTE
jgi:hypothetical protein